MEALSRPRVCVRVSHCARIWILTAHGGWEARRWWQALCVRVMILGGLCGLRQQRRRPRARLRRSLLEAGIAPARASAPRLAPPHCVPAITAVLLRANAAGSQLEAVDVPGCQRASLGSSIPRESATMGHQSQLHGVTTAV